jgi:hypothetical protein
MYYRYFSRIVIAVCLLTPLTAAQLPARDPNIEGPVVESLRKITDDDTASKFVAATDAMDKRDYETAIGLYEEVLKKHPISTERFAASATFTLRLAGGRRVST